MSEEKRIGFIGAGNMATALIRGLMESGMYPSEGILVSDKEPWAVREVSTSFGVRACNSNKEVVCESQILVLCVKPQDIKGVLEEVKGNIRSEQVVISIAAGIPIGTIQEILGPKVPVIRVMPNTPALVGEGMSALAGGEAVASHHMEDAVKIFNAVGQTAVVEESMINSVTALSGSGPGYIFRIMECMMDAGTELGLDKDLVHRLVVQAFVGASALARSSEEPVSKLRERVTSPGGTTEAGLNVLNEAGLKEMVLRAVKAAYHRALDLGAVRTG